MDDQPDSHTRRTPSRIVLGTAQLGMDYGIVNRAGKPPYERAKQIVAYALRNGVTAFDTAAAYGDSEKVLGRAFSDLALAGSVFVSSKVHLGDWDKGAEPATAFIERAVRRSCALLGVPKLDVSLMHRAEDLEHVHTLAALKTQGLLDRAGISVMTPDEARAAVDLRSTSGETILEAIQLPTSILDQRFLRSGVLRELHDAGVQVFARSAFLQGVVLMPSEEIPEALRPVDPVLRRLEVLATREHVAMKEMAIRFVLSLPDVDALVLGAELPEQIEENARIAREGPLRRPLFEELVSIVPDLPDEILMPNLWPWNR